MGFFSELLGNAAADRSRQASDTAASQLGAGYAGANRNIRQGYDTAQGYMKPYVDQGLSGQTAYNNALGLNGASGSATAQQQYQAARNPYAQYQQDQTTNALMRKYNAMGMGQSGTAALAAARANNEQGYNDYNNWLSRLQGVGQQGMSAAGTAGNYAMTNGSELANLDWGYNSALAGNTINTANAVNAAKAGGINNLLKGIGTIGGMAFAPMTGGATMAGSLGGAIGSGANNLTSYLGGGGGSAYPVGSFNNASLYPGTGFGRQP